MKHLAPILVTLLLTSTAAAQESRSAVSKIFLYGKSPGSPSTGKVVTVLTLHAATLAAWGIGTYLLVDRSSELDKLKRSQAEGCVGFAQCEAQAQRGTDLDLQRALAVGLFAAGSLTLLSGVVTAFAWDNEQLEVGVTPGGAWARVSF